MADKKNDDDKFRTTTDTDGSVTVTRKNGSYDAGSGYGDSAVAQGLKDDREFDKKMKFFNDNQELRTSSSKKSAASLKARAESDAKFLKHIEKDLK